MNDHDRHQIRADHRTDEARHNRTAWKWGVRRPEYAETSAEADPADFPGFLEQVAMSTMNEARAAILFSQANLHATQNLERTVERVLAHLKAWESTAVLGRIHDRLGLVVENTGSTAEGADRIHNRLGTLTENVVKSAHTSAAEVVNALQEMASTTQEEVAKTIAERAAEILTEILGATNPGGVTMTNATEYHSDHVHVRPYEAPTRPDAAGDLPIVARIQNGPPFLITGWSFVGDTWHMTTEPVPDAAPVEVGATFHGHPGSRGTATAEAKTEEDTRDYSGVHDYVSDDEDDEDEGDELKITDVEMTVDEGGVSITGTMPRSFAAKIREVQDKSGAEGTTGTFLGAAHRTARKQVMDRTLADAEEAGRAFREARENADRATSELVQAHARRRAAERSVADGIGPNRSWPSADTPTPVDDALQERADTRAALKANTTWPSPFETPEFEFPAAAAPLTLADVEIDYNALEEAVAEAIREYWVDRSITTRERMRYAILAAMKVISPTIPVVEDTRVDGTFRDDLERRRMADSYTRGHEEALAEIRYPKSGDAVTEAAVRGFQASMGWSRSAITVRTEDAIRAAIGAAVQEANQ